MPVILQFTAVLLRAVDPLSPWPVLPGLMKLALAVTFPVIGSQISAWDFSSL